LNQMPVEVLHGQCSLLPILDVRDAGEWNEGHIRGAMHVPYYFVQQYLQDGQKELSSYVDRPLAVICGSGQRSSLTCSILQQHSFSQLFNVVGGMDAWKDAGFETVTE